MLSLCNDLRRLKLAGRAFKKQCIEGTMWWLASCCSSELMRIKLTRYGKHTSIRYAKAYKPSVP